MDGLHIAFYESSIGRLYLAEHQGLLKGLWMEGQKYFGLCGGAVVCEEEAAEEECSSLSATLALTVEFLDEYFRGGRPDGRNVPVAPCGSEFRQEVWELLREIPYGETVTYGEIAKKLEKKRGSKMVSARAVGGAVGHNPIGILIPCHRVVGADGSLTGYAGGVAKKAWLLGHERAVR